MDIPSYSYRDARTQKKKNECDIHLYGTFCSYLIDESVCSAPIHLQRLGKAIVKRCDHVDVISGKNEFLFFAVGVGALVVHIHGLVSVSDSEVNLCQEKKIE